MVDTKAKAELQPAQVEELRSSLNRFGYTAPDVSYVNELIERINAQDAGQVMDDPQGGFIHGWLVGRGFLTQQ